MSELAKLFGYGLPSALPKQPKQPTATKAGSVIAATPALAARDLPEATPAVVQSNLSALYVLSLHDGGASAGELAKSLGPGSIKAQQVRGIYRRLENAGLVRVEEERSYGQSRPRWYITEAGRHAIKNGMLPDRWYEASGVVRRDGYGTKGFSKGGKTE